MRFGKILVTGGTGFVGKHLQEEFNSRGVEYVVFPKREYDLTLKEQTEDLFASHRDVSVIVHLACYQAAGDFPARHTAEQFYINNLIHLNVLEGWRKFAPHAKLLAIGSSCAYPSRLERLSEEGLMDGSIHGSVYAYAFTKRLLCTGVRSYNDQYNLNGSYLIPSTMYGEYDDFDVKTAHVCGALIGKFVRAVREGNATVEIWGDGSQVREFMYVKDFVRALLYLIPLCDRDVVNVGPGKGVTIKELAERIGRAADFKGSLFFNRNGYVGVQEKVMDVGKLAKEYKWVVSNEYAENIKRVVEWYSQNYNFVKDGRKVRV